MKLQNVYPQIVTAADMLKSTIRIDELISFLQQEHAKAAAIVNSKLYGLLPFWRALKKAEIHPVVGLTVRVQFGEQQVRSVVLYAATQQGYQHLLKVTSAMSIREGEVLPLRWLEGYQEGCILMIPMTSPDWTTEGSFEDVQALQAIFGKGRLYVGIDRPGGLKSDIEQNIISYCHEQELPICATQLCTFMREEHAFSFEVAKAIEQGMKMNVSDQLTARERQQFVPHNSQWQDWFADYPEWLLSAEEMLLSCQVNLAFDKFLMPKFPTPNNETAFSLLEANSLRGLQERVPNASTDYIERLHYELGIIQEMGYADYFLIVSDYIQYAKSKQILTGPGRGSSASSLVAYTLRITDVDPLQYGLLFERFLNPERITMPDIDVDFADHRRQEVIQYVADKYGKTYTSQIITFGTLSAKAVARDVARVFGFTSEEMSTISSLIPNKVGITLREALEDSAALRDWIAASDIRRKWIEVALNLEGLPRNASTHAAGVVLSPEPLVNIVPIEPGNDGLYITQWPMQEVESIGLLKMDFLGLRNLTILERIRSMIYYDTRKFLDFEKIPLHDPSTFKLLQQGDTTGVFQLESDGMRQALRDITPTVFQDIVAIIALYRPGPMDFIPVYSKRKHGGEAVIMPHPVLEPILRETYGVIVYQEQIMQIASVMAGFTMGEADILRRAVSKKKKEILDAEQQHFVKNSVAKGFTEQVAVEVYDLIVRFANYGFPKSHAVAYSVITYHMAYLKANFPTYFYAALLTSTIGNQDRLMRLLQEVKQKGITVLPPSIHHSGRTFRVENGAIRFALSAIKGVPHSFLTKLLSLRKNGHSNWADLFDFALDMTGVHFTRKALEPLIKAGALDDFGRDRGQLLASIEAVVKHANLYRPNDEESLLSDGDFLFGKPKYANASMMPEKLMLQYEKEVLGFYMSEHPILKLKKELQLDSMSAADILQIQGRKYAKMLGIVSGIKQIRTKKGEQMAFIDLEDESGMLSITIFPREYSQIQEWLQEEQIVLAEGFVELRNGKAQMIVKKLITELTEK
ncbi:DNA polymerase III subunit epsilon [Viridibacillus arvi]|uniref:DNA-directed DNA polymerase n=1 Tax=Viridibacillus arvi TaxID=263475 RepID=A0A0M0LNX7_9BACL|nr:DNA polymerase III subunit epsilon [Viridibacillus arvi]